MLFDIRCLCNQGNQGDCGFGGIARMRCAKATIIRHYRIPPRSLQSNYRSVLWGKVQQRHSVSAFFFSSPGVTRSLHPSILLSVLLPSTHPSASLSGRRCSLRHARTPPPVSPSLCLLQRYINYYSGGLKCARLVRMQSKAERFYKKMP